jgi:hypothetical protein
VRDAAQQAGQRALAHRPREAPREEKRVHRARRRAAHKEQAGSEPGGALLLRARRGRAVRVRAAQGAVGRAPLVGSGRTCPRQSFRREPRKPEPCRIDLMSSAHSRSGERCSRIDSRSEAGACSVLAVGGTNARRLEGLGTGPESSPSLFHPAPCQPPQEFTARFQFWKAARYVSSSGVCNTVKQI